MSFDIKIKIQNTIKFTIERKVIINSFKIEDLGFAKLEMGFGLVSDHVLDLVSNIPLLQCP